MSISMLFTLLDSMRGNPQDPKLHTQLIAVLNSMHNNMTLDLSNLSFDDMRLSLSDIKNLFNALNDTPIKAINFSNSHLYDGAAIAIAQELELNCTVTHLTLKKNGICAKGAIALAKALKINNTLIDLDLENNEIGPEGACAIAEALKVNRTLICVNLKKNEIAWTSHITTAIPVSGRQLSINRALANLAHAIQANTTLKKLDLEGNYIKVGSLIPLIQALTENFTITQLIIGKLTNPDYSELEKGIHALAAFIRSIESRIITKELLVISSNFFSQKIDDLFQELLLDAFNYHKNKIEQAQMAISTHFPIEGVARIIADYVGNTGIKEVFLTKYRNTIANKNPYSVSTSCTPNTRKKIKYTPAN